MTTRLTDNATLVARLAELKTTLKTGLERSARLWCDQEEAIEEITMGPDFSDVDFENESFVEVTTRGTLWSVLWAAQCQRFGLKDSDGHMFPWARPYYEQSRQGYRRGQRVWLEQQRARLTSITMARGGIVHEGRRSIRRKGPQ